MPELFRCINCNKDKKKSDFYPDNDRIDGVALFCTDCTEDIVGNFQKKPKKKICKTCFGYGLFKYDGTPLPIKAARAHYPAKTCPECGANWSKGKPSRYDPKSLDHLLVFWKGKQSLSSSHRKEKRG